MENTTLDSIRDKQGNILTNLEDIAKEIYIQQSIFNQPFILACHHQPIHDRGEILQILQNSQEGFRQERCTSRQLQTLIVALEDSRFTQQDIYLLYIDFKNAFGSIDHARLLAIMADLGYP
jgi:hypothetical protein